MFVEKELKIKVPFDVKYVNIVYMLNVKILAYLIVKNVPLMYRNKSSYVSLIRIQCFFLSIQILILNFSFSKQKEVVQTHHWREGNLPANSKCHYCKKTCWSTECLAGMRCEWCGITVSELLLLLLSFKNPLCKLIIYQSINI